MPQALTIYHASHDPETPVSPIKVTISDIDNTSLPPWSVLALEIGPYASGIRISIHDDAALTAATALYEALGFALQDVLRRRAEAAEATNASV